MRCADGRGGTVLVVLVKGTSTHYYLFIIFTYPNVCLLFPYLFLLSFIYAHSHKLYVSKLLSRINNVHRSQLDPKISACKPNVQRCVINFRKLNQCRQQDSTICCSVNCFYFISSRAIYIFNYQLVHIHAHNLTYVRLFLYVNDCVLCSFVFHSLLSRERLQLDRS